MIAAGRGDPNDPGGSRGGDDLGHPERPMEREGGPRRTRIEQSLLDRSCL